MHSRTLACAACLILTFTFSNPIHAGLIYVETIDGDLSNDRLNPTDLALSLGANSLTMTSVSGDRDYVTLTVPTGKTLDTIVNVSYAGLDGTAFIGVQAGTALTEPPTGTNPFNLLGWTHFGTGPGTVGTDILDDMGANALAIGFTPPLAAGDYTFWIQQTGAALATYRMDFNVSPEPACLALLALPLLLVRCRRSASI